MISTLVAAALIATIPQTAVWEKGTFLNGSETVDFAYPLGVAAERLQGLGVEHKQHEFANTGYGLVRSIESPRSLPVKFASGAYGVLHSRIAIQLSDGASLPQLESDVARVAIDQQRFRAGLFYATYRDVFAALDAANEAASYPGVLFAHPLMALSVEARSNPEDEPLFSLQWHLRNIGANGSRGGPDINPMPLWNSPSLHSTTVAVIDLGFEQDHPEVVQAWLHNPGEIPGNRRDDDGNGLVDDVRGWNFDIDSPNLIYGSAPNHGTAVSGIVAGSINGIGIAGVCPTCKILPIVIYSEIEDAVAAFYYARDAGARVVTNSWGYGIGEPRTALLESAMTDVAQNGNGGRGTTIVFAMPNGNRDACRASNPDISAHPDVVAVSSVGRDGRKILDSGNGACLAFVGPTRKDPENGIVTTDRMGTRGYNTSGSAPDLADLDYTNSFGGTSAAAPVVAGAFALLYAAYPDYTALELLTRVKRTAQKVAEDDAAYDKNGHSLRYGFGMPDVGAASNF